MDDKTIALAIAIDDRFSAPALVMLRSACRNLSPGWRIEAFILGYRLARNSKATVLLTHPWMVVTYPLWQVYVWLDFRMRRRSFERAFPVQTGVCANARHTA